MNKVILTIVLVLMSVISITMTMDLSVYARATIYTKEDLEVAVHDAALQISQDELSEGNIVFDQEKAREAFKQSFLRNTGMREGADYKITEIVFFDHSNSTFPVEYNPSKYRFSDTILYPTLIAFIQTTEDKYFLSKETKNIDQVASYTYRVNEGTDVKGEIQKNSNNIIPSEINENGLAWPVPSTKNITSEFNPGRIHPITGKVQAHNGMDIADAGVFGQPAVSVKDGTVIYAGQAGGYGNVVMISHGDGFETRYGHLDSISVKTGDKVKVGQEVGKVGSTGDSTGAHLHFETRMNGEPIDPRNFY